MATVRGHEGNEEAAKQGWTAIFYSKHYFMENVNLPKPIANQQKVFTTGSEAP